MTNPADLFSLSLSSDARISYQISRALAELLPGKAMLEGLDGPFDLDEFVAAGCCDARPRDGLHPHFTDSWTRARGVSRHTHTAVFEVTWESHVITVARAQWMASFERATSHWVLADDRATAEAFVSAVCAHCNEPRDSVLVFDGRCWAKSRELWSEVQGSSFDDLVLAGDLAREIRDDFTAFLSAREEYARYGVPWKRGVLFVGPPGNGKTRCLLASIRLLGVPCLYVQSLNTKYGDEALNIAKVFERARAVTPCCLVFEDLDAMINNANRSSFLNQLDGFADASGLLTLATTNHPERLNPAILERPSRFDRKYTFALPGPVERERYIRDWNDRLNPAMRIPAAEQRALVADTDGFSFAYLKELFLSSMLRWMKAREPDTMAAILRAQLATLTAQMRPPTPPTPPAKPNLARSVFDWVDRKVTATR